MAADERFCTRCGADDRGDHRCERPRRPGATLEPPRYCADCGAKLSVQVLPMGFIAECLRCTRRRRFERARAA